MTRLAMAVLCQVRVIPEMGMRHFKTADELATLVEALLMAADEVSAECRERRHQECTGSRVSQ